MSQDKFEVKGKFEVKTRTSNLEMTRNPEVLHFVGTYVPPRSRIITKTSEGLDDVDCCKWFSGLIGNSFSTITNLTEDDPSNPLEDSGVTLSIYRKRGFISNDAFEPVNDRHPPSIPEPPPRNSGIEVTKALIQWLETKDIDSISTQSAINLVASRNSFGIQKYGQPLMSQDGRDSVEDAMQEMGDLLQYLYKAKLNGEDITKIRRILPVLSTLIHSIKKK